MIGWLLQGLRLLDKAIRGPPIRPIHSVYPSHRKERNVRDPLHLTPNWNSQPREISKKNGPHQRLEPGYRVFSINMVLWVSLSSLIMNRVLTTGCLSNEIEHWQVCQQYHRRYYVNGNHPSIQSLYLDIMKGLLAIQNIKGVL